MWKIGNFRKRKCLVVEEGISCVFSKDRWGRRFFKVPQSVSVRVGGMGDAPPGLGMMGVPGGPPPPGGP